MDEINSKQDLINFFENGCKKESEIKIGVEHERFIFDKNSNKRINFETTSKILNFLTKFGWKTIEENMNVVALSRNRQKITLEPGNQIELSGAKLNSIHLVCEESYKFLNELKRACSNFDLKMMSVSYDPLTNLEKVPKTPKQRYEIMTEEMPKNGKLSLHMMYQTCGTQINLDYTSEKDFIKKFKLSSFLVPLSIGIFANSPIKEKKLSGYLSYRSKVWQNTSRAGLPKIFLENLDFEKYTDMAINMPLLFVLNNSNYLKGEGKTFKDFMEGKLETLNGRKPKIKDFDNHLTTIFTEVRLKRFIEIRSLDTCEWDCHCSGPAFYAGLLYGSLNEAFHIIDKWDAIEVLNAYKDVLKKGLNTIINNKTLLEWGKIFLELAQEGLEKRSIKNNTGKDESIFLRNIENILNNNKSRAFVTIEKFKNNNNLEFLYEKN
ncbi:MAG: glutamate-cysteine ligase family protein [Pelagibacteraceae bacterium]|jgi:glutamate--cysteine ligase|nr:glutamate-cysteine ligase family protein [Pelagibacteraceae bacterium]MDP6709985.1 glutamate-cysteine ligase family protein [Pelagibacteraceae bacterium]|tara:strand:+ start:643 stop:1947 length:1305 start_codon:yes stop_codon:yes gene_type:complete